MKMDTNLLFRQSEAPSAQANGAFSSYLFAKQKKTTAIAVIFVVENTGIEPVTSCMPCKRSPS